MEQLTESISVIAKENDSGSFSEIDEKLEGFNTPKQ